ncbi:MAG: thiolase family protein [Deltaproteobacteria bacterium]|nr:thiolase family protein [Deltaproteobacteria bacterium]
MKDVASSYPRARIPYGTWGTSYFPAWQQSPLAEVNIAQFAGESAAVILGKRRVPVGEIEYCIIGSTVPWLYKFWTAPLVSRLAGRGVPGFHMEQACATGLQTIVLATTEVHAGANDVVGVVTFDRCSDSPAGVFPERRAHRRTQVISDVWDNFGFDPATSKAMITSAGRAARKHKLDRRMIDEITACRYEQYFSAVESGFMKRYIFPLEVLSVSGAPAGVVDGDTGIRKVSLGSLREMPELDTCVTGGTQTHAADGMGVILVATPEKARELSPRPEIDIQLIAKTEIKTLPALMPEAPTIAVQKLLSRTGLALDDMAVVKDHNPFAVNDAIFCKTFGFDWRKMNNNGCSLVFGHPQGPTLTRVTIEAFEEAVDVGGGYVLVFGCAAGDVGIAALFKVSDGGKR